MQFGDAPLVSVLVPAWNAEAWISPAIQSALNQTYRNLEIVVCDDGSTDETLSRIKSFCDDPRLVALHQENGGVSEALNACYRAASGSIISLLDADDLFLPDKIQRVVEAFAANGDIGAVFHRIVPAGPKLRIRPPAHPKRLVDGSQRAAIFATGGFPHPPASGMSFRRDALRDVFPLPASLRAQVDGYIARGVATRFDIMTLGQVLSIYRLHDKNLTGILESGLQSYIDRYLEQAVGRIGAQQAWMERQEIGGVLTPEDSWDVSRLTLMRHYVAGSPALSKPRVGAILSRRAVGHWWFWRMLNWLPPPVAAKCVTFIFSSRSPFNVLRRRLASLRQWPILRRAARDVRELRAAQ